MAHAFNDWNVVPEHSVRIAEALKGKVPLMQYYHQGGHGGAPPLGLRNLWFTRYLYGVQNGVENQPKAWVTRETAACPPRTAAVVGDQSNTATLTVANTSALNVGMTLTVPQTNANGTITDTTREIVAVPNATTVVLDDGGRDDRGPEGRRRRQREHRVLDHEPDAVRGLPEPGREGGRAPAAGRREHDGRAELGRAGRPRGRRSSSTTPRASRATSSTRGRSGSCTRRRRSRRRCTSRACRRIKVRMASSKAAASLSVWLVALPFTPSVTCTSTTINTSHVITRGWADPQNRGAISGGAPLVPGQFVDVAFNLEPTDKVVLAGQRLGLMVFSSDRLFTLRPQPGTELTVDLAGTSLSLPVVGGSKAFTTATGGDEEEAPVGGTVPATLSLTLGAPAQFGAFTPGVAKRVHGVDDRDRDQHRRRRDAVLQRPRPPDQRRVLARRAAPDRARQVDLDRPDLQRERRHHVQAAREGQRPAAHGRLQQDGDLHAQHDAALTDTDRDALLAPATGQGRRAVSGRGGP